MRKFIVVGMPRTGSTLLQTGLAQHPEITAFGELFHAVSTERKGAHAFTHNGKQVFFDEEKDDAISYLEASVWPAAKPGSRAVGFKLFAEHVKCRGTDKLFTRLKEEIPDLRVIHIVRPNYLDVLTSKTVASTTKSWVQFIGEKPKARAKPRVRIEANEAMAFFEAMNKNNTFFKTFFGGGNYLQVKYESLVQDFASEMASVYAFLGVLPFNAEKKIVKQIDRPIREVVENYGELREALASTKYAGFFKSSSTPLQFVSDNEMRIGDYKFDLDVTPAVKTKFSTERQFVMMKPRRLVEQYKALFDELMPANLFELGIRRGGSMAFYNLAFRPQSHVAIEIEREEIPALQQVVEWAASEGRRMRPCFGVDQGNRAELLSIVKREFDNVAGRPIDLVIDDASHRFEPSISTFETLFPLVRQRGVYAIEDWGWAHWPRFQDSNAYFAEEPALTNMIFKLIILHTCRPDIISAIRVRPVVVLVERGPAPLDPNSFRIADHLVMRGKQLHYI
jgi:LPS sulfotransferase NodH